MSGIALYVGPSLIDGSPIAVIATDSFRNTKTGRMIQTWIIRTDVEPHIARRDGRDYAICGNCMHRKVDGADSCYVRVHNAPLSVYRAFHRGRYQLATLSEIDAFVRGRDVRIGSYGDPAAVPTKVWSTLVRYSAGHTGYTHQWENCDPNLKAYTMASVDTAEERERARSRDWRTFRIRVADEKLLDKEFACPAAAESGHKTTCEKCGACDGTYRSATRGTPSIVAHGAKASRYVKFRASM